MKPIAFSIARQVGLCELTLCIKVIDTITFLARVNAVGRQKIKALLKENFIIQDFNYNTLN